MIKLIEYKDAKRKKKSGKQLNESPSDLKTIIAQAAIMPLGTDVFC